MYPAYGGFHPNAYHPYPAYGGYNQPALTPFPPYPGLVSPIHQTQYGVGSYPAAGPPFAPYLPNGVYGGRPPYYPNPSTSFQPSPAASFPINTYNPSYKPQISAVTAELPDRPSGIIPDPFGSVAPVLGNPSYSSSSSSSGGSSYVTTGQQQNTYKPITIIESSYKPSYSTSTGSSGYKPSSSSQDGYDSITVTAQGYNDQPSGGSYKPSSSYKPSGHRPSSTVVQGSIQEIPNGPLYYPGHSQNRPHFYSATSDRVLFPKEDE